MIPVIQFSWRAFTPTTLEDGNVGELDRLAREHLPAPFVVHEPGQRLSAVVVPELVVQLVEARALDPWQPLQRAGLFDELLRWQLTAGARQPAVEVARAAAERDAGTVLVLDGEDRPVGVLFPGVVLDRLPRTDLLGLRRSAELRRRVAELAAAGDLAGLLGLVEEEYTDFGSELLRELPPDPPVCDGLGVPHVASRCPCPSHDGAGCDQRPVAG
jgi:hypothetical protein